MQVRIFSAQIEPGTTDADALEVEVNTWLQENSDMMVISYDTSTAIREGRIGVVMVLAYEFKPEGLPGDVTFPQFQPMFR